MEFPSGHWSLVERLHADFNDREAHTHLPIPIARFREAAKSEIYRHAKQCDDVETASVDGGCGPGRCVDGAPGTIADYARLFDGDVDEMMSVLVPAARFRKGHYAYGRFTVAEPHGLHTELCGNLGDGLIRRRTALAPR